MYMHLKKRGREIEREHSEYVYYSSVLKSILCTVPCALTSSNDNKAWMSGVWWGHHFHIMMMTANMRRLHEKSKSKHKQLNEAHICTCKDKC
jgi:hypothetical protein